MVTMRMAQRAQRRCTQPGCGNVHRSGGGKCLVCRGKSPRPSAAKRGYGRPWQKARRLYLAQHTVCRECGTEAATVVDHIVPHRGDEVKFWDVGNWQGLCEPCHTAKTGRGE